MKRIVLLFILISGYAFSQGINAYQYVIVPVKFTVFKESDKFNLNTNVKLLLQKYGFKAFLSTDSIPTEIAKSNCKKLHADLVKDNTIFFLTKIKLVLKDCSEKVIYETAFGKSSEKELPIAYNQALREAGKSFDKLNYKYNSKNGIAETINTVSDKVQNQTVVYLDATPTLSPSSGTTEVFYFAQPVANGYQVVDSEPKVIMKLFNTSQKNVFMAVKGDINGTVISKNGQWFFEYYKNDSLVSEPLNLKF